MKKLILPLVAMILCMASCQKENGILYLETETYTGDAKLHLDSENFAVWDNNDKVLVNGTEYSVAVGSGNATITGVPEAESYTAIYPSSWANSTSITYPAEQTWRGSQVVEAPMAAYSDGGTLTFHNLGSLLAVEVTNSSSETMSVQKIEVSAEGSTLINGTCAINGLTTGAPYLGGISNGSTTTTLKCNGVSITAGNTETFYIAMPPVEAQLTIKVYDQYYAYTKTQASAHTMAASHGYAAPIATSDSPVQYAPLGNQLFYTATSKLIGYEVGDSKFPTAVTSHTFSNGQGIITFESSFTSIPDVAFAEMDNLQSITLSSNVTSIGALSFIGCYNLSSVVASNVTTVGERAFMTSGADNTGINFNLPNLTTIESAAFNRCNIKNIDFSNVTTIGEESFFYATLFDESVTLDLTNTTSIETSAFEGIGSISKLILPVSPNNVGNHILGNVRVNELYFHSADKPIYEGSSLGIVDMEQTYVHLPASTSPAVVYYWTSELYANVERILLDL